jgi:hypothetical protein
MDWWDIKMKAMTIVPDRLDVHQQQPGIRVLPIVRRESGREFLVQLEHKGLPTEVCHETLVINTEHRHLNRMVRNSPVSWPKSIPRINCPSDGVTFHTLVDSINDTKMPMWRDHNSGLAAAFCHLSLIQWQKIETITIVSSPMRIWSIGWAVQ